MRGRYVAGVGIGMLLLAAQAFAAGELECRSSGYHYQYCPADTENSVQLAQQLSNSSCQYGRSWGYDQRGVWVDNGCAARFSYGRSGGHHRSGGGDVAAGVAAAVILGALLSSDSDHGHRSNDDDGYQDGRYRGNRRDQDSGSSYGVNVPAWAIGHFAGPDREGGPDIEIAVDPDGRINGMQGSTIFDGQMRGTEAWIGNRSYGVVRTGNGIRLMGEGHGGYDLYRE